MVKGDDDEAEAGDDGEGHEGQKYALNVSFLSRSPSLIRLVQYQLGMSRGQARGVVLVQPGPALLRPGPQPIPWRLTIGIIL